MFDELMKNKEEIMPKNYNGSCHCGGVRFAFSAEQIQRGLRCNCSICKRKGATMTAFTLAPEDIEINAETDLLSVYEFGSCIARHYFCNRCWIFPFHQTMRKPGHYRINIGCLESIDSSNLPFEVFDGAEL
ncbi:MAG: GFA family protein [Acidiferrobacterales bacterium]|nr:GFA family protein [Acidiferrobacterales bacterium]